MKNRKGTSDVPKVFIAKPSGRPFQLRYFCPAKKRKVRVSIGNRDEAEAQRRKSELEAMLLLGLEPKRGLEPPPGPEMEWGDFRERYRTQHLSTVRESTAIHAESRLDLAERILRPKTLGDVADPNALHELQARLLAGSHSRRTKPRSHHTVRGYMNSILAALNWAYLQDWLPNPPKLRKIKAPKQKAMKGRPITHEEFQRMLSVVPQVVGDEAAASWTYLLRGLWESALRLGELLHVSWDRPQAIRPRWKEGTLPVLEIPAAIQKNDTEETIPLLPWFDDLLNETPAEQRKGWVFNPQSLQLKKGRQPSAGRPKVDWVGKVVARIGEKAEVEVEPEDVRTGRPAKFATAHDLRRSCAERLREAGVPPLVICRVMRHSSWETTRRHYAPGNIQRDAETLRDALRHRNPDKTTFV